MAERLGDGKVGIMELNILSHQGNRHFSGTVFDTVKHLIPLAQIAFFLSVRNSQLTHRNLCQSCIFQHYRSLIENGQRQIFNDTVLLYVAEQGDFLQD